jgi:hypothetical protein
MKLQSQTLGQMKLQSQCKLMELRFGALAKMLCWQQHCLAGVFLVLQDGSRVKSFGPEKKSIEK